MLDTGHWSDSIVALCDAARNDFATHLQRLDALSLQQRFGFAASDRWLGAYVAQINLVDSHLHGIYIGDELRAAIEIQPRWSGCGDVRALAITVESPWRQCGIGKALLLRAIAVTRRLGARDLVIDGLSTNRPMRHLVSKFDCALLMTDSDCQGWLRLVPGTG